MTINQTNTPVQPPTGEAREALKSRLEQIVSIFSRRLFSNAEQVQDLCEEYAEIEKALGDE